ncbi:MAG: hypothetical protein QM706_04070 [Nitrospira sp.]
MREVAAIHFRRIFLEEAEPLVLRMLSKFAEQRIDKNDLKSAKETTAADKRTKHVTDAFKTFDRFAN